MLGWGAIGSAVGRALADGEVPGARLCAVADRRRPSAGGRAGSAPGGEPAGGARGRDRPPAPIVAAEDLADGADVVVEAAGQAALATHGEAYLQAGARLLVVSVGALVDTDLFERLQAAGGDRLHLTTGAIGGLDLLRAARRAGSLDAITLTTTKRPSSLVEGWMDDELTARLRADEGPVVVFDGPASEAVRRFPQSVNVAATLALTAGSWDLVRVRVVGDPAVADNRHEIEIDGAAGHYRFRIENRPSPDNPRTSGIVAPAVVQGLAALAGGDDWRLATG